MAYYENINRISNYKVVNISIYIVRYTLYMSS